MLDLPAPRRLRDGPAAGADRSASDGANGPAFRRGVTLPAFDNVDVYPLLARLIGVRPRASDGNLQDLRPALAR